VTVTAKDVAALRRETDMPMMDCKKALTEAAGDIEQAKEILFANKKGKMEKRTERTTGEGRIGVKIDGSSAVIVEVQTETDFTARNDKFVAMVDEVTEEAFKAPAGPITPNEAMTASIDHVRVTPGENANFARGEKLEGGVYGAYVHHDGKRAALVEVTGPVDDDVLKGICQHIVFHDPKGISEDDVPAEQITTIREEAIAEAKESGKPDEIAGKIAEGKVRKFLEESTLLNQKYVLDEDKSVRQLLPEGVTIKKFIRYTLGG